MFTKCLSRETYDHVRHDINNVPGPVFRASPNELSFASLQSYRDIYGFPTPGKEQCIKSDFYDIFGNGFATGCIGSERNPKLHAKKKKNLLAAFSAKALAAQEDIIQRCIDGFVSKIGPISQKTAEGINMVEWFEMSSFDLLGEMAFGESFGCIRSGSTHLILILIDKRMADETFLSREASFLDRSRAAACPPDHHHGQSTSIRNTGHTV